MELQKALEVRRSIRKYDGEQKVTKEMVCQLIAAALEAPSWKNTETARYHCIMSQEKLEKFCQECLPESNRNKSTGSSALIVCTFVKNQAGYNQQTGEPDNEVGNGWGCYDCGLANENLILKAAELGLGTLIMGLRDAGKIRRMLDVAEEEEILSVIAVGFPAVNPTRPKRREINEVAKFY